MEHFTADYLVTPMSSRYERLTPKEITFMENLRRSPAIVKSIVASGMAKSNQHVQSMAFDYLNKNFPITTTAVEPFTTYVNTLVPKKRSSAPNAAPDPNLRWEPHVKNRDKDPLKIRPIAYPMTFKGDGLHGAVSTDYFMTGQHDNKQEHSHFGSKYVDMMLVRR